MTEQPKTTDATWKLPDGIEDHIESGIIKATAGAVLGGIAGVVLFRSGGGWRAASAAMGSGIGIGSAVDRASIPARPK
eukprot:CAMPEP_0198249212 /NCGR_PEP_ID=MMETSP1447-20131203/794_1 /TAXON_ID=420782 /ORGANISM="Chaetoceros dichaeta, Strain CCMP1751" /LENGTH=77 /DNA_ID=CAMNT_0043933785 /DNA_START=62 /DNA_END=295 /DNA_ORIENTATION=-